MGAVAAVGFVAVLASTTAPAAGQVVESFDPAAVTGGIDPASIVDFDAFSARAEAWAAAQVGHRQATIARAEALAAETKAAEAAEEARIEEEEAARRQAEEEALLQAEREARRAAEAAASTTTTLPAGGDGSEAGTIDDPTTGDESSGDSSEVVSPDTGPTPEQWHALRQCESGNNYRAVSPTGRYRGAYQFSITTWDWLAASQYPALVGVDPIDASPADQDRMAYALYAIYGVSPWPVCGVHLL